MSRREILIHGLACALLLAGAGICRAEDEADATAKIESAFLLNFARFTAWPDAAFENDKSPLVVAVIGQPRLLPYLQAIVKDETVDGRKITVRSIMYPAAGPESADTPEARARTDAFYVELRKAHLVFAPREEQPRIKEILGRLHGADLLLVSDAPNFIEAGGMLELRRKRDRIVFDANGDALDASRVRVSSKVLKLAQEVKREKQ